MEAQADHNEKVSSPDTTKLSCRINKQDEVTIEMEAQADHNEIVSSPATTKSSCRINKRDEATFVEDLKDHIDVFIHASMEEHKNCLKSTMNKVFEMTKAVKGISSMEADEALLSFRASLWDWE